MCRLCWTRRSLTNSARAKARKPFRSWVDCCRSSSERPGAFASFSSLTARPGRHVPNLQRCMYSSRDSTSVLWRSRP